MTALLLVVGDVQPLVVGRLLDMDEIEIDPIVTIVVKTATGNEREGGGESGPLLRVGHLRLGRDRKTDPHLHIRGRDVMLGDQGRDHQLRPCMEGESERKMYVVEGEVAIGIGIEIEDMNVVGDSCV